jgi:hypothetical protein
MRESHSARPPAAPSGRSSVAEVTEARRPTDPFSFVKSETFHEPSRIEVRKDGRTIGRILHVAVTEHADEYFQFHKGLTSIASSASAQFTILDKLKKWIRESQ